MENFKRTFSIPRLDPGKSSSEDLDLIREMPLTVSVNGLTLATTMRTPGLEKAQAAGLCLGDGILTSREDLLGFEEDASENSTHIQVRASDEAFQRAQKLVEERGKGQPFPPGASDEDIADLLSSPIAPFTADEPQVDRLKAHEHAQAIWNKQHIHHITRSAHASFVFDRGLNQLSMAEDVGRHNALDKALGMVFLDGKTAQAEVIIVSCRMNKDVVRKCANARIPVVFSISRPTTAAVLMARKLNMTLALSTRDGGVYVFSGRKRIG
ncbi:formate dehydrogenase accessory sulfurtransferase FdhD [Desulfatibacillum aliphaticivorans]|uniref:Formate dehydrogenase subunit FdhD n=1 Tax=Desulfatibacillum aliphaticivorans TaxID=218208 RepID=B8FF84_DESAL|nr:formate dehydrogenase accessory sulfurtransferase FdhD [Desulfatibacillum aliphaticivorans]ACL03901.1 formate dehydrogenase subunit FdhD [Desulfatibacillum aliphaticivorans]